MKDRLIIEGYKEEEITVVYDLPYEKTKKGYFFRIIDEKIEEALSVSDYLIIRRKKNKISWSNRDTQKLKEENINLFIEGVKRNNGSICMND